MTMQVVGKCVEFGFFKDVSLYEARTWQ